MTSSLFGVGASINVNVNGTLVTESFVGLAGQTSFTIAGFTYTQGTNSLQVFINGQRQISGRDFLETSPSTFQLLEGVVLGDNVDVIGFPELNLTSTPSGGVIIGGSYTLNNYITDEGINPKVYPYLAQGNGISDDTIPILTAVNAALSQGKNVNFPPGVYRTTAPIVLQQGVSLYGSGAGGAFGSNAGATELYFDHAGVGIQIVGSALRLSNFRTRRNQPPDLPGWVPAPNDYDIGSSNPIVDITFDNLLFFNPTRAVKIAPGSGRIWFHRIGGHPLTEGIFVEAAYDIVSINGVHWWPYWTVAPNVQEWTLNNSVGLRFNRCDDPTVNDYFHIWAHKGISIGQWAGAPNLPAGSTSLLRLSNIQFDIGDHGYYVEAGAASHTALWTNVLFQGCQGGQPTIALTGGTAFSSFVPAGGSTYTLTLTGNAIVPTVNTWIYINVTAGSAPDGWYQILSVTNANVFVVQGAQSGQTIATASFTLTQKIGKGLVAAGTNSRIQGTNVYFAGYQTGCVSLADTNYVGLTDSEFISWNTNGVSTEAAVQLVGTSEFRLSGNSIINPIAPIYVPGSGGIFRSPYWLPWTPVVTAQIGVLTSYTITQAIYMNDQYTVKYMLDVTITNIGTGAGSIHISLPPGLGLGVGYVRAIGAGREIVSSGHALTATVTPGSTDIDVLKYDNTFPAINGSRLVITGSYAL